VLTVGETIIYEYQFCDVMAKSNKDPILAARRLRTEQYAGGILAVANHLANFCDHVGLVSMLGEIDSHEDFVASALNRRIHTHWLRKADAPTIVKRRFLQEYLAVKLFELYEMKNEWLTAEEDERLCNTLEELLPQYDVVVVADYGHGFITDRAVSVLCDKAKFLAVNAQTNEGNRGFNLISKYPRADYVSIDEPEARLETRRPDADPRELIRIITTRMDCSRMMVTRGKKGCLLYDKETGFVEVPAFSVQLVDRMGAGDAVLALTAPCVALGLTQEQVGFIGNVVGAEACAILGKDLLGRLTLTPAGDFPLLVKFLDSRQNLSVQVHPSEPYAAEHPEAHLKSEAWYIVEAEPGSVIYKGIHEGVTPAQFRAAIEANTREAVEPLMIAVPARVGDCHYLPSGTCHALGKGILVAEVQTPSDTTFRVFDWGRQGRELHIGQAMQCIHFGPPDVAQYEKRTHVAGIFTAVSCLVSCEFFRIEKVRMSEAYQQEIPYDQPTVWIVLKGKGRIELKNADPVPFTRGETLLLAANMDDAKVILDEDTIWLEVTFPQTRNQLLA